MDNKYSLSDQFLSEEGDEEYSDLHFRKSNRKSANDRQEKKKIKKFAKYDM